MLGTGPINSLSLVAQSSHACSCGIGLTGVVDGAWSRTLSFTSPSSPVSASRRLFSRSLAPSSFSIPFPPFPLLTSGSSWYCCSIFTAVLFESVAVVVVVLWFARVAVLVGAEVVVVVVVMCHTSTARSAGCDGGVISVCRSSSEARNFAIAFRACSGNRPDRVLAQFSSMRVSCTSNF